MTRPGLPSGRSRHPAGLWSNGIRHGIPGFLIVLLLVSSPFILSFFKVGMQTVFGVFAADAMYFLAIAKNTVIHGFFTFNQETVTNGFQPLWQYMLVLLNLLLRPSLNNQLLLAFILNIILVILGIHALVRGVRKYWGAREAAILPFLLLPGAFALFFEPALGHRSIDPALLYSFSSWAFVNGVESGVTVAAFGFFINAVLTRLAEAGENTVSGKNVYTFWPRLWLPVIILARLDDIFIMPAIAITLLMFERDAFSRRIRDILVIALPAMVVVLLYMAYNLMTAGIPLPISGLQKTGFALLYNLPRSLLLLVDYNTTEASRIIPMVTFLVTGGVLFFHTTFRLQKFPPDQTARERNLAIYLVLPLAGYIFLKAVFHFTMVNLWHQGWWYYVGQIFVFNFLVGLALCRFAAAMRPGYVLALLFAILVCSFQIVDTGHRLGELRGYALTTYKLWNNRQDLNNRLAAIDRNMKLIDNTDGLYAFILDMPVASGTGLAFSKQELEDARVKGNIDALVDRGFTVMPGLQGDTWEGHYNNPEDLELKAEPIYIEPETNVTFYRLSR